MQRLNRVLAALAVGAFTGIAAADEAVTLKFAAARSEKSLTNQQLADDLARAVQRSGRLSNYSVDFEVDGGVVTVTGSVANPAQHANLLNIARRHPGVVAVNDKIEIRSEHEGLIAAKFQQNNAPKPLAGNAPASEANQKGTLIEPAPIHSFAGGVMPYSDAPVMPPHAWPAYTPYNNYASMAYQTQYPSGAWPFIGPPYPYPMIPAGWRHVSLRWHHGYWWLKFHAH